MPREPVHDAEPDRPPAGPPPDEPALRAALARVLASRAFSTSERLRRFLRYIVEESLAGRAQGLKEYSVGTEACDRPADFDPRADPVVRVEARRLRARLADYYADEGREDPVVFSVPKGGYVPRFQPHAPVPARADAPSSTDVPGAGPTVAAAAAVPLASEPAHPSSRGWRHAAVLATAALAVTASLAWVSWGRSTHRPMAGGVAVLPFQNASADPENEHFCFGLVEDLTAELSGVQGLRVVARTSAEQFRGGRDLGEIARALRVRYVVEGSVRREGQRLRVTARLVDTADGVPVWSDIYDRDLRDVFDVQNELAGAIASALVPRLGLVAEPMRARRGPGTAEAHALFLKGQFLFRTRPDGHAQAIEYLTQATQADPAYAPAHLELAAIHATVALDRVSPPADVVAQARQHVERALGLDPTLADAVALKAWIGFFDEWDWSGAEDLFEEALALNPSSPVAHHRYALLLMTSARFDEALVHARRALDLDPLSYRLVNGCAVIAFCARRYAEAERLAREATVLAPRFFLAHLILGSTLVGQHRIDEGIRAYRTALDVQPGEPDATSSLARALALAGREAEARQLLAALESPDAPRPPSNYELAFLLGTLGERDRAFAALERAVARHETELVYLKVDPLFDPIRDDPRFAAVLRRVGVPGP